MITKRQQLEDELGTPIPDTTWEWVVGKDWPNEIEAGKATLSQVAAKVREGLETFGGLAPNQTRRLQTLAPREKRDRHPRHLRARTEAVAVLLAKEAEQEEALTLFRRKVLRGRLVEFEHIRKWIKHQARKDGPATVWLEVPLPHPPRFEAGRVSITPPVRIGRDYKLESGLRLRTLKYAEPDCDTELHVAVAHGGVLDELRSVSEYLASKFGWQGGLATVFILTDRIPLLVQLDASVRRRLPISAASRVILTVDPGCSPRQVADAYQKVRRNLVGPRHRELSEKHLVLAQFGAERKKGETLAHAMKQWNKRYPKWQYRTVTNFGRDVTKARQRLLQPGL